MSAGPEVPRSLSWMLSAVAGQLREAADVVQGLLADTAGALGWYSDAASATSLRAQQTGGRLEQAAARIEDAETALMMLAQQMEYLSAQIEALLRRRAQIIVEAAATPLTLPVLSAGNGAGQAGAQIAVLDEQIRAQVQSLTVTDRAVGDRIRYVVGVLRALAEVSGRDGWVTSLADPKAFSILTQHGVLAEQGVPWIGPVDWDNLAGSALLLQIAGGVDPFGPSGSGPGVDELLGQLPAGASNNERAQVVAAWFAGLTALQQVWYTQKAPDVIGNLDGIPFGARDQANRVRLAQAKADLMRETEMLSTQLDPNYLSPEGGLRYAQQSNLLTERTRAVEAIEGVLLQPDRHLVTFELPAGEGHPRAAVAVGDLDTAANIAVYTPGLNATVATSLDNYDNNMDALRKLALNKASKGDSGGTVAAVTWIGYDAPAMDELLDPARSVALDLQAHTGGSALNQFYAGISANRVDDPHVTALGHSYGSLTTSVGLQEGKAGVDDVVLFGSPGLDTSNIADLHVPAGHAFVLEARKDWIADLASFGPDPNQMDGVTDLSTAATRTIDGVHRTESIGHSSYLSENSTSQYNVAVVVAGLPELAATGSQFGISDAANYPFTRIDQWLR